MSTSNPDSKEAKTTPTPTVVLTQGDQELIRLAQSDDPYVDIDGDDEVILIKENKNSDQKAHIAVNI
jgi:hypothetical protein